MIRRINLVNKHIKPNCSVLKRNYVASIKSLVESKNMNENFDNLATSKQSEESEKVYYSNLINEKDELSDKKETEEHKRLGVRAPVDNKKASSRTIQNNKSEYRDETGSKNI
ncbi:hypothetical protein ABK040_014026 [Willaertia magna]